jgi:hypothetical protein
MTGKSEQGSDGNGESAKTNGNAPPISPIVSSLAGMILEQSVRSGHKVEIPSLGITIGQENLRGNRQSEDPSSSAREEADPRE